MKYAISQVVYFIGSRRGQILVEPMEITKIERGINIDQKTHFNMYSGYCPDDPESIPHTESESLLFPSYEEAINEIQRQLSVLRAKHD